MAQCKYTHLHFVSVLSFDHLQRTPYTQHGFTLSGVSLKECKTGFSTASSHLDNSISIIRCSSSGREQDSHSHRLSSWHVSTSIIELIVLKSLS